MRVGLPFVVIVVVVYASAACAPGKEGLPAELVVRLPDGDCHAGDETCALAFADTETGALRVRAFDVINRGDEAGSVVDVGLIGDPTYAILAAPDTEIEGHASSPFAVGITPGSPVTLLATLFVVTEPSGTIEVALTTNAIAPANELTITPASCDFGDVIVGEASTPCNVSFANDGTREIELSSVLAQTPFAGEGVVPVPAFIQPGTTMSIAFVATPEEIGPATSSLSYVVDTTVHTGAVTFTVNGVPP